MKKLLKLLLFMPMISLACDNSEIKLESLKEVPVMKSGELKLVKSWGEVPNTLNENSYKILDLRATSKISPIKMKISFYKGESLIHGASLSSSTKIVKSGSSFADLLNKSIRSGADKMEIITTYGKGKGCTKEVRLWSGD